MLINFGDDAMYSVVTCLEDDVTFLMTGRNAGQWRSTELGPIEGSYRIKNIYKGMLEVAAAYLSDTDTIVRKDLFNA